MADFLVIVGIAVFVAAMLGVIWGDRAALHAGRRTIRVKRTAYSGIMKIVDRLTLYSTPNDPLSSKVRPIAPEIPRSGIRRDRRAGPARAETHTADVLRIALLPFQLR